MDVKGEKVAVIGGNVDGFVIIVGLVVVTRNTDCYQMFVKKSRLLTNTC